MGCKLGHSLLFLILLDMVLMCLGTTTFQYKRYAYRKKQRSERKIRNIKSQCEEKEECQRVSGLKQTQCVRQCMSSRCYDELYAFDELEEGEIDVRYNSFKGCILDEKPQT